MLGVYSPGLLKAQVIICPPTWLARRIDSGYVTRDNLVALVIVNPGTIAEVSEERGRGGGVLPPRGAALCLLTGQPLKLRKTDKPGCTV